MQFLNFRKCRWLLCLILIILRTKSSFHILKENHQYYLKCLHKILMAHQDIYWHAPQKLHVFNVIPNYEKLFIGLLSLKEDLLNIFKSRHYFIKIKKRFYLTLVIVTRFKMFLVQLLFTKPVGTVRSKLIYRINNIQDTKNKQSCYISLRYISTTHCIRQTS